MKLPQPFRHKWVRRAAAVLLCIPLALLTGWFALRFVPLPQALFNGQSSELELVDRNGEPLRAVRAGENPFEQTVAYGEIPRPLIEATLAAEDERFWTHHGVDFRASLRAAWQLAWHRRVISGGSTITQQLIKLAQPRPRTVWTKLIEAAQAARLEQVWDKQRILAEYLNRLDYGNFNRGVAAAARYYFAKPLGDLTPAECALLASLPQAPSRLNPYAHLERARKRQEWVLHRMCAAGSLTVDELNRALSEPPGLVKPARIFEAPHFVDLLLANYGKELRARSGSTIQTTVDLQLCRFAETVLREHLSDVQAQHVSSGAIVVLDNHTGEVLELIGSGDYLSSAAGQVNGAWAPRSPGSALKPFTYLLAMERGATPSTVVADVPSEFVTATGLFAPVNYNRHCYGPMRYRMALANSLNISAVKVLDSIGGPAPLQQLLQQCGLTTLNRPPNDYGLGLTIGNAEVRLLELANAYACLARLGEFVPHRLLRGPSQYSPQTGDQTSADAGAAYLIADILSDNDARTPAFGAESALRFDFTCCLQKPAHQFRFPRQLGIWIHAGIHGRRLDWKRGWFANATRVRRHWRRADSPRFVRPSAREIRHRTWYMQSNQCRVECWICNPSPASG